MIDWALDGGIQALFCGQQMLGNPPPGPIIHIESVLNSLLEVQRVEKFHEEGRQLEQHIRKQASCSKPTLDSQRRIIRTLTVVKVLAEQADESRSGSKAC